MLAWEEGQFELWHADVDGKDEIATRTAYLLMEGMRRMDEARLVESGAALPGRPCAKPAVI
jgi:hypothetical protein